MLLVLVHAHIRWRRSGLPYLAIQCLFSVKENLWFLPSTKTVCDMADFESSHAQLTSLCQQRCYSPNQAASSRSTRLLYEMDMIQERNNSLSNPGLSIMQHLGHFPSSCYIRLWSLDIIQRLRSPAVPALVAWLAVSQDLCKTLND